MNTANINYPSEELLGDQYISKLTEEFSNQVIKRTVPQSRFETALDDDVAIGRIYTRLKSDVPEEEALEQLASFNLTPAGNSLLTAAVAQYGIITLGNVSVGNTSIRLPQPVTGRRLVLINSGNGTILVFPSNAGGIINGLNPSEPLVLPNNSEPYEFVCVKNPNPGAWVITPPAVSQYDSNEITISSIVFPQILSSTDPTTLNLVSNSSFNLVSGVSVASEWSEDGSNKPSIITSVVNNPAGAETYYTLKPAIPWSAITKIKAYTNLSNAANSGNNNSLQARLVYSGSFTQYVIGSTATADIVQSGGGAVGVPMAGAVGINGIALLNQSTGTTLLPFGGTAPNIGDPGTLFGELFYGYAFLTNPQFSRVGTFYVGQLPNLDTQAPQNTLYDTYYTGVFYLAVNFNNFSNLTISNFKIRFFAEFTL